MAAPLVAHLADDVRRVMHLRKIIQGKSSYGSGIASVDTRAIIREFIAETFFVEDFADSDSFLQERIIDSTGMLEVIAFIEERFSTKINDSELVPGNLDSLDNLSQFLERKKRES